MDPHRLMRLCRVVRKVEPCGSFYFDKADRKKMNMINKDPDSNSKLFRINIPFVVATIVAVTSIYLLVFTPETLSPTESRAAALSLFAIGFWATGVIPAHLTAFAFFLFSIFFSIAPPSVIFSGFESAAIWLVFGGLVLGVAIRSSGLAERIGGKIASGLENRGYYCIIGGVVAWGVVLGFIMPSSVGRIVLSIPIALALSQRCGFRAGSKGRTAIILAATFGSTLPAFAILPSNAPNLHSRTNVTREA